MALPPLGIMPKVAPLLKVMEPLPAATLLPRVRVPPLTMMPALKLFAPPPANDDPLANSARVDTLPHRLDHPAAFVPEQVGEVVAHPSRHGVEVGVANARG